jgi:cell division protein FtsW (lipid II flippase)
VDSYLSSHPSEQNQPGIQSRLLFLTAIFVILYAAALTFSPVVRSRSWDVPLRWEHWIGVGSWLLGTALLFWQIQRLKIRFDVFLIPAAALLSGWGLITIYRLFPALGNRQSAWFLLGMLLLVLGLRLPSDLGFLKRYKYLWLISGLVLTALTLLFGTNPLGDGPRLWLGCCGFYFQPSEPLKLLLIIYLGAYFSDWFGGYKPGQNAGGSRASLSVLAPTLVLGGIVMGLLVVQRDLGTALIFVFLYASMAYLSSGDRRIPIVSLLIILGMGILGYFLFDLVQLRIEAWLNPWADPTGRSYQIIQSLIAIANGGLLGRGPGLGNPGLVPVAHSDFIFAAISEETGLVGAALLLLLLGLVVNRGLRAAMHARSSFHRYLAAGLTAYLVGQSILIIAGNIRLLPLTGVTLPFVSYGGSSLITSFVALLLLVHISRTDESWVYPLQQRQPLLQLGMLLAVGLMALLVTSGWWAIYRSDSLISRTDNLRRYISDLYARRGSLLDRGNGILTETVGASSSYERYYRYTDLGPVLGYTNLVYGQSGLEFSLDEYLRGLRGNPQMLVWSTFLLYGQNPPGLDVRLSIDETLQTAADTALTDQSGAAVLLDSASGEILVMASHPTFDANQLAEDWQSLTSDDRAPLLNRAAQGTYQPGTALGPLWFAAVNDRNATLPEVPARKSMRLDGDFYDCAYPPADSQDWGDLIAAGCPTASQALVETLTAEDPRAAVDSLVAFGLYSAPTLRLPVSPASEIDYSADQSSLAIGQSELRVSPLQMALAMGALSAQGTRPTPRITLAVNTSESGWVVLPPLDKPEESVSRFSAQETASELSQSFQPYWFTVANAHTGTDKLTWYLAATLPEWAGSPLALALVLESDNPQLARQIGDQLMQQALALPLEP